jgi:hypothetical protein
LGDKYRISYCESIKSYLLSETSSNLVPRLNRLLVIADPVYRRSELSVNQKIKTRVPTGLRPLMSAHDLARRLSKMFPGKVELRIGLDATKSLLLSTDYSNHDAIVVASYLHRRPPVGTDYKHSLIREPVICLNPLAKGNEGLVRISEIESLTMPVDLVVVLGREISFYDLMHFEVKEMAEIGWAFRHAGAKSILILLWTPREKNSTDIVRLFFRALKQGNTETEALRYARRQIRAQGYDHPYYWASFVLLGQVR